MDYHRPQLFIIAGHNGAGKSTFGKDLLPQNFQYLSVFDGDKIFASKRDELFKLIKVPKYAKQAAHEYTSSEFIRLTNQAIENHQSFAYEGHFSDEGPWEIIQKFREAGYEINMNFLGLNSVELSEKRVKERINQHGFFVPVRDIHYNYYRNLYFLNQNFRLIDTLIIYEVSTPKPVILFYKAFQEIYIADTLPTWFSTLLPNLTK